MHAADTPTLKIDQAQAIEHLTALDYQRGGAVYMRYIHPVTKRAINASKLDFAEANRYQAQGYDVYFVVNGGGHTDADVTECRAIFYEHDNLDKSLQLVLWQTLGLPEPTIQVDTGGKSIHSYWVFTDPISPEPWRGLQPDLLEYSDGDRSLKNPSRILRLAGSRYMKGENPGTTAATIVSNSGQRYTYDQLRAVIPHAQQPNKSTLPQPPMSGYENIVIPVPESIPLEICLSKDSRQLLQSGVGENRNVSGARLARDLIGTADYLQSIDQRFDGDPWQLFWIFCQMCPSGKGWDESEWSTIWKSAQSDQPTPSCKEDGVENCIKAWYWNNQVKNKQSRRSDHTSNNVVDHPTAKRQLPLTDEELDRKIDELLEQNLQPSQLTKKLNLLAKETDFLTPSELKRIYYERLGEQDQVESREERITEVDELLKVGSLSLKLADELPAMYAQPLIKLAQYLSLREEVYLLALLTGLSICHRTGTELVIHRGQGFSVPLNLFSGIVSESGQRKSPVIKAIITKPLQVLQREAKADHKAATSRYEADLERWDDLNKEEREEEFPDGKPQPPTQQKLFFFTSTSGSESINRQVAAHPDQPLLYLKDELMGVFTQQGKYSQGRGSEKQDFLSYYDGTGSTELLADGVRSDTETILLSILGSVQPEVLRKFTNNCSDPDGQWARFLWVVQALAAATLHDDDGGGVDVTELLAGLYRRVNMLPPTEYTLSRDAFKLYQKVYNRIEQLRVNCSDPGLRAVYSKMTGQLGRLVGNCHVIHELALGKDTPTTEIPLERMQQGVRLIKFFIEQVKLIRSDSAAAQGELSDVLVKIIHLSQRLGRIKAKHVQMNYKELNLNPDQIRNHFLELAAMGQGVTSGNGRKLEWEYKPTAPKNIPVGETVGKVGETVGKFPTAETSIYQGVEETVGKVGKVGIFSENSKPSSEVSKTKHDSVGADTWDCVCGEWLAPELGETDSSNFDLFPTFPTFPTVLPNPVSDSITAVGNFPTVSPTFPTVFQTGSAEVAIAPIEHHHLAEVKQPELDFNAPELAQSELGESVKVWFNSEWVEGILLQAPNNHPNPAQRITGWKVRILETGLERYFWDESEIKP